ncbi:hypothetical protein SeLEV6574_g08486, partial [Synchytrium endobioticum]
MHSRRHRQVPKMSTLSKILIVILIVVFLVHRIQAADDDEYTKFRMNSLSTYVRNRRVRQAIKLAKEARKNRDPNLLSSFIDHIPHSLVVRRSYVPKESPLTLDELSRAPAPEDSRERLFCVMEYNAYQYEYCEAIRFGIVNAQGLPMDEDLFKFVKQVSRTLATMMKDYLSLEVLYAVALGEVAPHLQTILKPRGETGHENARTTLVNGLRAERARIVGLIDKIRANPTSVSLDDA